MGVTMPVSVPVPVLMPVPVPVPLSMSVPMPVSMSVPGVGCMTVIVTVSLTCHAPTVAHQLPCSHCRKAAPDQLRSTRRCQFGAARQPGCGYCPDAVTG